MSAEGESAVERERFAIKRRSRIKYNAQQLELLERAFGCYQYPDSSQMEDLGNELGVSADRVAIWFQNRRSKFKRQQTSDHLQWMRKQVFRNEAVSAPSLPVFSPLCHVLSPLEPQITRRELPVDNSPNLTTPTLSTKPSYESPRQSFTPTTYQYAHTANLAKGVETQQDLHQVNMPPTTSHPFMHVSPYTPANRLHSAYVYGRTPFQQIHQENLRFQPHVPISRVSSQPMFNHSESAQDSVNPKPEFHNSECAQSIINSKPMFNYAESAQQIVKSQSMSNHSESAHHKVNSQPMFNNSESAKQTFKAKSVFSLSESAPLNYSVCFRNLPVPSDNHNNKPVSSTSFYDYLKECKPSNKASIGLKSGSAEDISLYQQENLKPYTEMSPLKPQDQLHLDEVNKEIQDKLLQQKALECLAQWC